jgi:hypothetical protein
LGTERACTERVDLETVRPWAEKLQLWGALTVVKLINCNDRNLAMESHGNLGRGVSSK